MNSNNDAEPHRVTDYGRYVTEIRRQENWTSGELTCERCGEKFWLHENGGELDRHECKCGRIWRQEHTQTDLVVYELDESYRNPDG